MALKSRIMLFKYQVFVLFNLVFVNSQTTTLKQVEPGMLIKNSTIDGVIEAFNDCKCVLFYQCDENNFLISDHELYNTKVQNNNLRTIRRLRCSNKFYYCCKDRTQIQTVISSQSEPPIGIPETTINFIKIPKITYMPYSYPTNYLPSQPVEVTNCGRSSFDSEEKFSWMAAIYARKVRKENRFFFKCGGTLIHPQVILTVQHCLLSVTPKMLRVVVSSDNLPATITPSYPKKTKVLKIIKHPQYYSGGLHNDIALIILERPYTNVNTICLPEQEQNFVSSKCVGAIWTKSNQATMHVFKTEKLQIIERQTCENLLKQTRLGTGFTLHDSFMCGSGQNDICRGIGGSPLMHLSKNNQYIQAGIVFWGATCGESAATDVFINVAKFRNWIDSQLRNENMFI